MSTHEKRHTCHHCHKLMPKGKSYTIFYDAVTNYIHFFCSWWHFTKWLIRRLITK